MTIFELTQKVVRRLRTFFWQRRILIELERDIVKPAEAAKNQYDASIETITCSTLEELEQKCPHAMRRQFTKFKNNLSRGDIEISFFTLNGVFAGYVHTAFSSFYDPAIRQHIEVKEHQIYQFDGYMVPHLRQGFISQYGVLKVAYATRAKGKTKNIAYTDKLNRRSLLYHYRGGFKETMRQIDLLLVFRHVVYSKRSSYTIPVFNRKNLLKK